MYGEGLIARSARYIAMGEPSKAHAQRRLFEGCLAEVRLQLAAHGGPIGNVLQRQAQRAAELPQAMRGGGESSRLPGIRTDDGMEPPRPGVATPPPRAKQ